jgi:tritrans,polycis-undecaprenyl-diphosphate synthase [geranylgeranyl-diphosphate specific]
MINIIKQKIRTNFINIARLSLWKGKMLERFKKLLRKEPGRILRPNHVAFTTEGKTIWAKQQNVPIGEVYNRSFFLIRSTINTQIKQSIPITTFYLLSSNMQDLEQFSVLIDSFVEFFTELKTNDLIHNNRIKVSVIGQWYDLPGRVVDPIKQVIDSTFDYDNFYVNFCINYHGQEEILDALKLMGKQIQTGKLDPDVITLDMVRENLASSKFLPPDLIIKNGFKHRKGDLLLWDSMHAFVYYTHKLWPDFDRNDFLNALAEFSKLRKFP